MTAQIEKAFKKYPLYSQDGKGGDAKIVVKYFGGSAATWLITEGEPRPDGDWMFFGFCTLGIPDDFAPGKLLWEWGYVTLKQLQEVRFPPFGLGVERDILVEPGKYKVKDEVFMCRQYGRD
ncbi:MAG: DUF2958 domain-containing protein [Candidatus Methanomethylophilaceae archaeon]|nr:DUF2958 domain-containing protein [Candidatus Methanomethylophilaceae archaeon]